LKQLTSILFITLFAFSQYEKQITYLECKLANSFKTSSLLCDCEKMADFDNTTKSPLTKTHSHIHPDDLFTQEKLFKADFLFFPFLANENPKKNSDEQDGFCRKYYHPPQGMIYI